MKIFKAFKFSALIALVLSVAVGCAGTPAEDTTAADQQAAAVAAAEQAISEAKASLDAAKAAGAEWRDTADMIAEAESALAAGDTAKAIQLANEANRQSQNALAQYEAEQARLNAMTSSYEVMAGDSLWRIAAQDDIYGNPYQWPLIYKANRDQIKDADLIYPGQVFNIERRASQADIDAAVDHARNRGAWALGVVEDSDLAYLAR